MMQVLRDVGGVDVPEYLAKLAPTDKQGTDTEPRPNGRDEATLPDRG
jgi:hypothetical protein